MLITRILCSILLIILPILGFSKNYIGLSSTLSEIRNSIGLDFYLEPKPVISKFSIVVSDYGEFKNFKVYENFYSEETNIRLYEIQTYGEIGVCLENLKFSTLLEMEVFNLSTYKFNFYYGVGVGVIIGNFYIETKIRNLNLFLSTFCFETKLSITNDFLEDFYIYFTKENITYPSVGVYSEIKLVEMDWFKLNLGAGVSVNFESSLLPYKLKLKLCLTDYELSSFFKFSQYLVETGIEVSYSF